MPVRMRDRLLGRAWPVPPATEDDARERVRLRPPKNGRVHLGCGDVYLRGYLNVDLAPMEGVASGTSRPDLECPVTSLACPAGTLEEVRLHHLFEHFERAEALALLIRWYWWLRPGGQLTIETPDFEACVAGYHKRPPADQALVLRHIFGSQEAPWAKHLDGWSETRFRYVLDALGYDPISTSSTLSDEHGLLRNVVVRAQRPRAGSDPDRGAQRRTGELILRQSMNGQNPTEEQLFVRWRARFDELLEE